MCFYQWGFTLSSVIIVTDSSVNNSLTYLNDILQSSIFIRCRTEGIFKLFR